MVILVVDDNKEYCDNIKDIMELEGHRVITAYDGSYALEIAAEARPELVLMDVRMPGVDGDGVATFEKMRAGAPGIQVILMSAYTIEDAARRALREGAFGIVRKPVDLQRLRWLITEVSFRGPRLLLVDDDRDYCHCMKDTLESTGCLVTLAYDGDEAVRLAWESDFDAFLIDMKLPSLNGLETYLAIREVRPHSQAVMITGYPEEMGNLANQAVQEEACTWLEKPVDTGFILSFIEDVNAKRKRKFRS